MSKQTKVPEGAAEVVVGVDDTPEGGSAVRTAADIAETFGMPLRLVRVWRDVDWFLSAPVSAMTVLTVDEQADRAVLDHAAGVARQAAPTVPIAAEFASGSIYAVLLERTRGAHTLVLGSDADEQIGDIAQWYLDHARCPVLVVDASGEIVAGTFHPAREHEPASVS